MTPFYVCLVVLSTVGVIGNLDKLLLAAARFGSSGASKETAGAIVAVIGLHLRGLLHLLVRDDEESWMGHRRKIEGYEDQKQLVRV